MFEATITIIVELSLILLVIFVYIKAPKRDISLIFAKFYGTAALWGIVNYLENEFINSGIAAFLLKLDFAIAPFIFYYYYLFCLNFPQSVKINKNKKLIVLFPIVTLGLISFSDLVIRGIRYVWRK